MVSGGFEQDVLWSAVKDRASDCRWPRRAGHEGHRALCAAFRRESDDQERLAVSSHDRANPKKSSPKTALNRKTLYRKSQKYSFLTPDWSAP
jgi:hypothetical protein